MVAHVVPDLRSLSHRWIKSAAVTADLIRPPGTGVVVLAYHRVGGGSALELDLPSSIFADQMAYLADAEEVVALDQAVDDLAAREGPCSVVVTFDDGTADFMDNALPALVEHRVPATYYVSTAFIEEQRPFPDDGLPLSWSALADALSTGLVTVGSHTHTHAVVDKLSPAELDGELRRCSDLIEDRLGVRADHFAYPKGVFGGVENEQRLARFHRSAALANCRVNAYGSSHPLRLDRTPIQRSDGMRYFYKKVRGGMRLEGTVRSALNRGRYLRSRH